VTRHEVYSLNLSRTVVKAADQWSMRRLSVAGVMIGRWTVNVDNSAKDGNSLVKGVAGVSYKKLFVVTSLRHGDYEQSSLSQNVFLSPGVGDTVVVDEQGGRSQPTARVMQLNVMCPLNTAPLICLKHQL